MKQVSRVKAVCNPKGADRMLSLTGKMKYLMVMCIVIVLNCAGSQGAVRFDHLDYPVSMSGFLYGKNNEILMKDLHMQEVGKFSLTRRQWSIGYSLIPLNGKEAFAEAMNQAIIAAKGDAMVNLEIETASCSWNSVPYLFLLPIWPGCADVKLTADIIREKRP